MSDREVLLDGKRAYPKVIDEFDLFFVLSSFQIDSTYKSGK